MIVYKSDDDLNDLDDGDYYRTRKCMCITSYDHYLNVIGPCHQLDNNNM